VTASRFIEWLIGYLKREPLYRFDSSLTATEVVAVTFARLVQVVRGSFVRLRVHSARGLVFAGRGVSIRRASQLTLGRQVILEDRVSIDALSLAGVVFGDNVTIKSGAMIVCTGVIRHKGIGLTIGRNSSVGSLSYLGAQGLIAIGEDVLIGPGVQIFSEDHSFSRADVPIRLQGERRRKVTIEDNCWIGAGVTIVGGVTIGRGSVVAAGSVVVRDIEPDSLAAGVPAKRIRSRVPKAGLALG
jgi:acetyltransferase-like isoleucine patch superfamily enzyme